MHPVISRWLAWPLHELDTAALPHLAYSPDLAPSNFYLFSDLKKMLTGKKYGSNEEVIAETAAKDKSFYKKVTQALIVPQELPSLLSLVYSNIPPIRKGTDSRLGFGFRLGNHADFQVLVELGPQKDTRPIGMSDDSGSSSKRQVNQNDFKKPNPIKEEPSNPGASWLQNWSNDMRGKKKKRYPPSAENETSKLGYVKTGTMIPESSLKQLQQLYKMASLENNPTESSAEETTSLRNTPRQVPTIRKTRGEITEELMDVELD